MHYKYTTLEAAELARSQVNSACNYEGATTTEYAQIYPVADYWVIYFEEYMRPILGEPIV